MKRILFFSLVITLLAACVIEQDITFNNDYSGTSSIQIDLSGLFEVSMSMSGQEVPQDPDSLRMAKAAFVKEFFEDEDLDLDIEGEEGLTNLRLSADTTDLKVNIAFDFMSVDDLNTAMLRNYDEEAEGQEKPEFIIRRERKSLYYYIDADTSEMGRMIQMVTTLHLPDKIKSCSSDKAKIDGKKLVINSADLREPTVLEIQLK
jgi:hypothetical protein